MDRSAVLGLGLGLALLMGGPAVATTFCPIPQTRDGFVALRAGPDLKARIIVKMRPGDEMMPMVEERGPWVQARYWSGTERFTRGFGSHRATGWVHKSLIPELCG